MTKNYIASSVSIITPLENEGTIAISGTPINRNKNKNSWLISLFALCCIFFTGFRANSQVNLTATGGTLSQSYTTLRGAFNAINLGTHTGTITIGISGNTNETTLTAVLNASGSGAASYTGITISPTGGAARTITGATTAGAPLINFNGADNVTVNGLNTGGNSLTIANTTVSATSGTSTIRFQTDASTNTITNCNLQGSATMDVSTDGGVVWFGSAALTTGNDNNTISFCNIGPAGANLPSKGIYFSGSSNADPGTANSGIVINGNNIFDYFSPAIASAGIYLRSGNAGTVISNNKFYQTATRTQTTAAKHSGIRIDNTSGNAYQITGNTIGFASSSGTGTYNFVGIAGSTFVGIDLSVGTTTPTSVQGNTVKAIAISGACSGTNYLAPFVGIFARDGLTTVGEVTGNTIGDMSATGSIAYTSSSASTSDVIGMFNFSFSNWTTNNNNIGGISVANSSSGAANIYGINCFSDTVYRWFCSNNTIGGNVANSISSSSTATGTSVQGLNSFAKTIMSGNIVRNLTAAGGTGTAFSASVVGILMYSGNLINHVIDHNTIYNLRNTNTTAATTVTGIQFTGGTSNFVENNFIYGLTNASNSVTAELNGIRVDGGSTLYNNNMIAIGNEVTNAFGTAPTNSSTSGINGFNGFMGGGGTDRFFHNTVYIGGAPTVGSGPSYAFNGIQTTNTRSFRNNIFVNNRTNAGATGTHYIIKLNGTVANPTGLTIDNNVYFGAGSVFGFYNNLNVANLVAWRTTVGQDVNSFQSNPQLLNPTNAVPDLHLHPSISTHAEGNGGALTVGAPASDYDGQTRSGLTPVDIGADAGNFTTDVLGPTITYTPLALTCSTGIRTLTTTISDAGSGMPTVGAGLPVLYWRINAGAYTAATATYVSGSTYTFTFGSGVVATDVVSYYIVAQDNLGNLLAFPTGGATGFTASPPNAITPPSIPSSYNVGGLLSGTKTVGVGGNYATLTAAVTAYNNNCLGGAVVFTLTDAIYPSEVFPILIDANADASAINTLTFRPATGVASTIFGTTAATTALIKLNGADYVTIDGLNAGGSSLTITNTNNAGGGVIWIASASASDGANNNSVQNCNINGTYSGSAATFAGIIAGSGTTLGNAADAANSNNSITGNTFKATQNGVYISGLATTLDQNWTVSNNSFGSTVALEKHSFRGMIITSAQNFTIANNTIRGVVSTITSSSTMSGIQVAGTVNGGTISGNKISDIKQVNSAGGGSNGIFLAITSTPSAVTVFNNFISDVTAYGSTTATSSNNGYGIMVNSGGGYNIYYNTVEMNTNQTLAGSITAALNIAAAVPVGAVNLRNNIFSNSQTVGTRYAIYNASTSGATVFSAINYNDYSATNVGFQTSTRVTIADWQTATGQDTNSKAIAPVFVGGTDLHLIPASNSLLDGAATPIIGITTDIDIETRNVTAPDMGADEFVILCTNAVGGTATGTNSFCLSITNPPIAATSYSEEVGTTYQWVFSTSSTNPVLAANVSGQNNPATLTTGLITTTTNYWLKTTCATNSSTAYSNMVTITNNGPAPTSASGSGTFCQTTSISANGGAGGTIYFQGTTSNGTSISLGGSPQTITTSGTYYFRSYDGICWGQQGSVAVVIAPNPTGVDATASVTDVCTGVPFNLFSTPGLPLAIILQQNFETGLAPWSAINTSTTLFGGNPALVIWSQQTSPYVYDSVTFTAPEGNKFAMANADAGGSGIVAFTTLNSPGFSTLGYSSLSVSFKHYYRHLSDAAAFVEVSTNGTTWTTVRTYSATVGTPTAFASTSVNLNAYVGNANLYVRFRHSGGWEWYWAVDDIKISGTPVPYTYSWTSIPAGFTSSLQNPTGVTQSVPTTYKVKVTRTGGCFTEDTISVGQAGCSSIVNLKLFIEGYYQGGGLMRSVKNNQDGVSPTDEVENITVELRNASAPYGIVATSTAILKTNGTAVCNFPTSPNGSYYIAIKTSNAVQTWSVNAQTINPITPLTYDFSTLAGMAYGSNMKSLGSGVFGFYLGDLNQDGNIDTIDYPLWESDSNNFLSGQYNTDMNGDGNVDTIDYPIWEENSNNFVSVIIPN